MHYLGSMMITLEARLKILSDGAEVFLVVVPFTLNPLYTTDRRSSRTHPETQKDYSVGIQDGSAWLFFSGYGMM
jgi:hypothetical protein